jgi:hypothetical protein
LHTISGKHVEGLAALTNAGKLPVIPEATEPAKPSYCRWCGCLDGDHVDGFCPV